MCKTYLEPMSNAAQSGVIKDWRAGGGLFLDYCEMLQSYERVEQVGYFVPSFISNCISRPRYNDHLTAKIGLHLRIHVTLCLSQRALGISENCIILFM
jgi:hypothetical protein